MPDLLDKIAGFTKNIARYYTEDFVVPANIIRQVFYIAFLFFTLPLFLILMGFQYFAVREQQHSIGLRKQFESFGKRKRNQEKPIDFE
jgi:ATP-dependent Zn protease